MKRVAVIAVVAAGFAALGGCKACDEPQARPDADDSVGTEWRQGVLPRDTLEGESKRGGTLTIRWPTEPPGINRLHDRYQDGWTARMTIGPVYETLLQLDRSDHPRYRLKPLLAESYTVSADGLTNTLNLRRGVKFHSGAPFTSRDVKAVLDAVMNPANATTTMRSFFVDLESYDAPDDHTFVLKWKRRYYMGFRHFATSLPMMPSESLKGDFDTLPIARAPNGTGPFRFVSWETGNALLFERNAQYWADKTYLDRVVFRIVKDPTVAQQLFERGEFDLMIAITPELWTEMEKPGPQMAWARDYNRIKFVENNYSWIGWNQHRPFFRDRDVRRALGMLFPYEQVRKNIDRNLELPTTCPFYVYSPNCDESLTPLKFDPEAANALLDKAGWVDTNDDGTRDKDGIPLRFTFLIPALSVKAGKLAPLLQELYAKAGIEMDIERVDWAIYMDRLQKHQFDAATLIWSQQDVEQDLYQNFHSSQTTGSNFVNYNNPEVDGLLVEARAEFDAEARAALNRRIHRLVYEDQVYTFMSVRPTLDAVKKRVRGIQPSIVWYDLKWIWLEPLPGATDGGD